MSIATEKTKNASERFTLVRMVASRYLDGSAGWANIGGTVYSIDLSDLGPCFQFKTLDADIDPMALTYDEATGILTLDTGGAAPADGDFIVVYYYLFFTSGEHRQFYQEPDTLTGATRNWEPRLRSQPAVESDFSDIRNGVFTVSQTKVDFNNEDAFFERYLGPADSFYNQDVKIWVYINGFGNGEKIFSGIVGAIEIGSTFSVQVLAQFAKLNTPAYVASSRAGAVAPSGTNPESEGKPLPLIIARDSWAKFNAFANPTGGGQQGLFADGLRAFVISYDNDLQVTTNRDWRICRTTGALKQQSAGSLIRVANSIGIIYFLKFSAFSNYRVGDTLHWTTAGTDYYGFISGVGADAFTFSGFTYDLVVLAFTTGGSLTTGSTIHTSECLQLSLFVHGQESPFNLLQGLDYTITTLTLSNGTRRVSVTLTDDIESRFGGGLDPIDPVRDSIRFSIGHAGTVAHAAALKLLLEDAGLTCNAASFTAADAALVENLALSIPNIDETKYANYLKYIQDILTSTGGYLWIDNAGAVHYDLLAAPASGDAKGPDLTHLDSIHAGISYQDIVSSYTPQNPHRPLVFIADALSVFDSGIARWVHHIFNEQPFRHVMEGVYNQRITEILAMRGSPQVTYTYETSTDDIDSLLGQDVTLQSPRVLGGSGEANVKIVSVDKSAEKTVIKATDLQGL